MMIYTINQRMKERQDAIVNELDLNRPKIDLFLQYTTNNRKKIVKKLKHLGDVDVFKYINFVKLTTSRKTALEMMAAIYNRWPNVIKIENNALYRYIEKTKVRKSINDLSYYFVNFDVSNTIKLDPPKNKELFLEDPKSKLWNLENILAYEAQRLSKGEGVKIGIIDTGVDYNHKDLKDRFGSVKGYNFINNSKDPMDDESHGTHVAGTIAGSKTGIAIKSRLYALKVLDSNGSGSESNVMKAIEWALDNKLDIVNLSLGSPYASIAFEDLVNEAYMNGLVIVAAAGNEGKGPSFPASFGKPVIAVAAVDRFNNHPSFSNIYYTNDISAPGVEIVSCFPNNDYEVLTGTSMATPHVTGVSALYLSKHKNDDIDEVIKKSATRIPYDGKNYNDIFGAGLINAYNMLNNNSRKFSLRSLIKRLW